MPEDATAFPVLRSVCFLLRRLRLPQSGGALHFQRRAANRQSVLFRCEAPAHTRSDQRSLRSEVTSGRNHSPSRRSERTDREPTQVRRCPHPYPKVEYQPGIIVMEHGDQAIRSFGSDGLTWTFYTRAPHVSEFQMGKIVFATGGACGRIIMLKPQGDTVKVILGPVQLTEIVRSGSFAMDAPARKLPYNPGVSREPAETHLAACFAIDPFGCGYGRTPESDIRSGVEHKHRVQRQKFDPERRRHL